jgi:hypothetical protein
MIQKLLAAFLFINFFFAAHAQKEIREISRPAYKNAFYIRPLNAVDLSHANIAVGYERRIKERNFLSLTTAYHYDNIYDAERDTRFRRIPFIPTNGLSVELEHKWFNESVFYYAASISVRSMQYQASNIFNTPKADGTYYESFDFFNAKKQWVEASGKIGWRIRPSNKLFLDFYLGAGIRYKHTWYTETESREGATIVKENNIYYYRDRPGHFLLPVAKGGISFGYKF